MNKSGTSRILILLLVLVMARLALVPCTIIVVGKKATIDGSVITSHTDACDEWRLIVVPATRYPRGSMAPVYFGLLDPRKPLHTFGEVIGQIPQAEATYAYIHSGYSHINEHQLAIGESTTSQRPELQVDRKNGRQIMTVEQAMAFALQRCRRARDAVSLIGDLVEEYGFLPSTGPESETLAIADTQEAWIMEILSVGTDWTPKSGRPGAIWAAERVPDDQALIVPNWLIIKEVDPSKPEWFKASPNYRSFAEERGWYDPKSGTPFVWQDVYAPLPREWATSRFWLFYSTIAPSLKQWPKRSLSSPYAGYDSYHQTVEPLALYPFSARPEKKLSLQDLMAFQRSVFEGTIYDMTSDADWLVPDGKGGMAKSPLTTPFPTRPMRDLLDIVWRRNVSRGGYGMIAQLRDWLPDPIGGLYWFYVDNQYTSIYVPIYAGVESISPLYNTYDPDRFDEGSARWVYDFVDNLLYLRWQDAIKDLRRVRDPLEGEFILKSAAIDQEASRLHAQHPARAKKLITDFTRTCMERAVKAYRDLRLVLISKYTNNKQGS